MASINPNGKRRRNDHAASTLSKPFKSPLRRPTQTTSADKDKEDVLIERKGQSPSSSKLIISPRTVVDITTTNNKRTTPTTPISTSDSHSPSSILQTSERKPRVSNLTPSRKTTFSDPVIPDLQKKRRVLQSRLSTLRSELDIVQQALRVESSTKDDELEALITKWKQVSQDAAEEVFVGANERVTRMGGMKPWRERIQSTSAKWEQEEIECWYGNAEAEGVNEDELETRKAEILDELEVSPLQQKKDGTEGHEDEEFTMDFMLKTLNIDLKIIGYDKSTQSWIKD